MITLEIDSPPRTGLHECLTAGVRAARRTGASVLVSVGELLGAVDPLALFAQGAAVADTRLYWESAGSETVLVGIGAAREFTGGADDRFTAIATAWRAVQTTAQIAPGAAPALMGGFAFDPQRPTTAAWRGFPPGLMVLPRFLLARTAAGTLLTTSIVLDPTSDATAEAARLASERWLLFEAPPLGRPPVEPGILRLADVRPAAAWKAAVGGVAADIRAGAFAKAVLAREVLVEADAPFDPATTLRRLRAGYPDCFLFAVARGGACFLGATPERLARLDAGRVQATCLAGSTRRAVDTAEDARLGAALLASAKDREEHAVVVRMLSEVLAAVCAEVQMPPAPALLRLRNVQHLYTPIGGRLRNGTTLLELVARLHPTPAVGGFPREDTLARIRACEDLDRGWYAGPVGWLGTGGDGEFAVAIRSALLAGSTARAFAGCGIVADSHPDDEYAETHIKLRAVLSALGEGQA